MSLRTAFPTMPGEHKGGTSDGYCYRTCFSGASLEHSLQMVQQFLIEEGYGDLPLPKNEEELKMFRLPSRNKQLMMFEDNGYTKEEMKLVRETQKIMGDRSIAVTATAIRIPVVGGHSEAVNVEFSNDFDVNEVRSILHNTAGVTVQDNLDTKTYPMPIYAQGKDDVFVGRIRRDESQPNTLNMWIVADNLRKGAATNTIQIAEYLVANKLV